MEDATVKALKAAYHTLPADKQDAARKCIIRFIRPGEGTGETDSGWVKASETSMNGGPRLKTLQLSHSPV